MRNYQIYLYFLRDGVVLHDTGVGTVPNKQNFASTAKRWLLHLLAFMRSAEDGYKMFICSYVVYDQPLVLSGQE